MNLGDFLKVVLIELSDGLEMRNVKERGGQVGLHVF